VVGENEMSEERHNDAIWVTRDERKIAIEDMSDEHLVNCFIFLRGQWAMNFRESRSKRFIPLMFREMEDRGIKCIGLLPMNTLTTEV
jgi:hypothetical protein